MDHHIDQECKYRPHQCPDCLLEGTHCYVQGDHKNDCLMALEKCPAHGCSMEICSALVLFHTATDCQFVEVECNYARINCLVKLTRPQLENHERDEKVHLQLLLETFENYKTELEEYKLELDQCKVQSDRNLDSNSQRQNSEVLLQHQEDNNITYSTTFCISNFSFFSSMTHQIHVTVAPNSYQLQLEVVFDTVGQRIRLFLYMVRGHHDNTLHWPFSGEVKVELLDQGGGNEHHERTLNFPAGCGRRVEAPLGRSEQNYCFHDYLLYQELRRKRSQFVINDTLMFRVSARYSRSWLACVSEPQKYYLP